MMTNLFSMFDPSSSFLNMNWTIMLSTFMISMFWMMSKSKMNILMSNIILSIKNETSPILSSKNFLMTETILISMFYTIIILNLISMIPHNFTFNSHIAVTFPIALVWWMSMMLFGWMKKSKVMIFHSLPTGTPTILINFMILIEMISNMIRPLTLSIRLSANMIAGHLLMNLLGSINLSFISSLIIIPSMIILSILELAVSCIQAYVFMMLTTLYSTEMN